VAPFVSWAIFKESHVTFEITPSSHTAENGAIRTLCNQCGTSLSYCHPSYTDKIDIVLTVLDDIQSLKPKSNIWTKKMLPWLHHLDEMRNFDEFK